MCNCKLTCRVCTVINLSRLKEICFGKPWWNCFCKYFPFIMTFQCWWSLSDKKRRTFVSAYLIVVFLSCSYQVWLYVPLLVTLCVYHSRYKMYKKHGIYLQELPFSKSFIIFQGFLNHVGNFYKVQLKS